MLGYYGEANKAAVSGTICHKVLEILAAQKLAEQQGKDSIYDAEVLKDRHISQLDNIYSLIDEIYFFYTKHNTHIEWSAKDLKECYKLVDKALTMNGCMFDPRNREIIQPEQEFNISLDEFEWAKYKWDYQGQTIEGFLSLKGTIDLVCQIDTKFYEIIDWKFGRMWDWTKNKPKGYKELKEDFQLRLYHYIAHRLYPEVEDILVTINYIKHTHMTLCFTKKDVAETIERIRKKFEQIKSTKIPKLNIRDHCKWCSHSKNTFGNDGLSRCKFFEKEVRQKGLDYVVNNLTAPGHSVIKYKAPGSV